MSEQDPSMSGLPVSVPWRQAQTEQAARMSRIEQELDRGWGSTFRDSFQADHNRRNLVNGVLHAISVYRPLRPVPHALSSAQWMRKHAVWIILSSVFTACVFSSGPVAGSGLALLFGSLFGGMFWISRQTWRQRLEALQHNEKARPTLNLDVIQSRSPSSGTAQIRFAANELDLILHQHEIVIQIQASKSWHSGYLDVHRVRLNLTQETCQVIAEVLKLHVLKQKVGPEPARSAPTWSAYQQHQQVFALSETALRKRVAALKLYLEDLHRFDGYLEQLDQISRYLELDTEMSALFVGAEFSSMAADHTLNLSDDLRAAQSAVEEIVSSLARTHHFLVAAEPAPKPIARNVSPGSHVRQP
ncbi:hypothetical protein [Rhodococcus sp. WMMA185]|uniref:hypothetical protein n=1 Tax=Rhodococcus sp. WMMA185 TaxID=679318 RepID=UPI0012F4BFB6|nr:hypothetical protein [Rhodococcus sp. WMMA185]